MTDVARAGESRLEEAQEPSEAMIARRAFEIFEQTGGTAEENWRRAEAELREETAQPGDPD